MPRPAGSKNAVKKAKQHPLVSAMINELPPPGAKWDTESREKWLKAMREMFDYSYGVNGDVPSTGDVLAHVHSSGSGAPLESIVRVSGQATNGAWREAADKLEQFINGGARRYVIDPDGFALHGTAPIDPHDLHPGSTIYDYRRNPDDDLNPIMWKSHGAKRMPLPPGVQLRSATEPWINPRHDPNVETP